MFKRVLVKLEDCLLFLAIVSIFGMMIAVVVDTYFRYFSTLQFSVAYNLSELYFMPASIFLAMAYTQRLKGHTKVTFFFRFFGPSLQKLFYLLAAVASVLVFSLITWEGFLLTLHAVQNNEIFTGTISWPMFLAYGIIPLGALVMTIRNLYDLYEQIRSRFADLAQEATENINS